MAYTIRNGGPVHELGPNAVASIGKTLSRTGKSITIVKPNALLYNELKKPLPPGENSRYRAAIERFEKNHILPAIEKILGEARKYGHDKNMLFNIKIVLEEWLVNIPQHAHMGNLAKPITVRYNVKRTLPLFLVIDRGPGFKETPKDSLSKEAFSLPRGKGTTLIGALARAKFELKKSGHHAAFQMRPEAEAKLIEQINQEKAMKEFGLDDL